MRKKVKTIVEVSSDQIKTDFSLLLDQIPMMDADNAVHQQEGVEPKTLYKISQIKSICKVDKHEDDDELIALKNKLKEFYLKLQTKVGEDYDYLMIIHN